MARVDLSLPAVVVLLLAAGLATLSSAAPPHELLRQGIFLVVGLAMAGGLLWMGWRRITGLTPYLYVLSLVLLVAVSAIGTTVNGAKSWLYLGPLPGFQPSEFAKLTLILVMASVMHERPLGGPLSYARPILLLLPPLALVVLEPDLGTALVIAAIGAGMMLVRGVPWRHLAVAVVLLGVAVPTVVLPHLGAYQRARLVSFVNPSADPQGSGYQVIQSTIAVGSGGLFGKGYKKGTQSQLGFIPFRQTDFIFPVLAEEGGFVASVTLLLLYGVLFWRLVAMANDCPKDRDKLVIMGVMVLISFQVLVNIGVTLGLAPVTGITLPLVSYGGTSLISTLLALGLALVVHRDRFAEW